MPVVRLPPVTGRGTRRTERSLPVLRSECEGLGGPGTPCPYVSCKHHLYLDVSERSGRVRVNSARAIEDLEYSCVLAVTERGPATCETIAALLGVSRQAVQHLEARVLDRLRQQLPEYLADEGSESGEGSQYELRGGGFER